MNDNQGEKYDLIATGFAKMRSDFNTEKKYVDFLIQHLNTGAHILDVGCGSGHPIASYLIKNHFKVTGIDGSAKLLKIAKQNCPKITCLHGDVRTINLKNKYDAIIEWWCLFHLPKKDHEEMISRFSKWLKPGGILEFTTGGDDHESTSSDMLNQELSFYSLTPNLYEQYLKKYGFEILLKENDQPKHLVWIAKKI